MLLLCPEFIYDDMDFMAVAEVSFCDPINDFSYKWSISGASVSEIETVSGNSLKLPPGTFETGKLISVTVTILNNENLAMAKVI